VIRTITLQEPKWSILPQSPVVQYILDIHMSADRLVQLIQRRKKLRVVEFSGGEIKIAPDPFSSSGNCRWPFYAVLPQTDRNRAQFVVKRFKTGSHEKERYDIQTISSGICAKLSRKFHFHARAFPSYSSLSFVKVSTAKVTNPRNNSTAYYNLEKLLQGEFFKFNNNAGYVNIEKCNATMQAFSHWTYHFSKGVLMVTDLQGIYDSRNGKFWLSDPAIHCECDLLNYGQTNLGYEGFKLFFETHRCNDICRGLQLTPVTTLI